MHGAEQGRYETGVENTQIRECQLMYDVRCFRYRHCSRKFGFVLADKIDKISFALQRLKLSDQALEREKRN